MPTRSSRGTQEKLNSLIKLGIMGRKDTLWETRWEGLPRSFSHDWRETLTPWWKEVRESPALEEESEAPWSQICLFLRKQDKIKQNPWKNLCACHPKWTNAYIFKFTSDLFKKETKHYRVKIPYVLTPETCSLSFLPKVTTVMNSTCSQSCLQLHCTSMYW